MTPPKTVAFTIVARNYGAYALTLMQSLRDAHPEWDRVVLLVDRCDADEIPGKDLFETVLVESLPLPDKRRFLFRYGVMELSTAVKPWMFAALRARGYDRVVYLDPDILVLDRLEDVERLLDEGAAAVVTPHLTAPMEDGRKPAELDILIAGSFNLGFLAIRASEAADAFVAWWQRKLEHGAAVDFARGMFTDQKWVDLAPGMFGGFAILRDAGYNLAYWNLAHRPVTRRDERWLAAGVPLRFVHFSGFDPQNPQLFSKHQDRFDLDSIGALRPLAIEYARRVLANGHAERRRLPYAFGHFQDGTPIIEPVRTVYRDSARLRRQAGEDPFAAPEVFLRSPPGDLPAIAEWAWNRFAHLQGAFPDPRKSSREGLLRWLVVWGGRELGIADAYLAPLRAEVGALEGGRQASTGGGRLSTVGEGVEAASVPALGRLLLRLHLRFSGGALSPERLAVYRQISGPVDFLRVGLIQFRRTTWARRLGWSPPDALAARPRAPADTMPLPLGMPHAAGRAAVLGQWVEGLAPEPGGNACWLGTRARLAVSRPPSGHLEIHGIHSAALMRRKHGDDQVTLLVDVDGEAVGGVSISAAGRFRVSLDLPAGDRRQRFVLGLTPDRWFVPSEIGEGADDRRLSVQIERIELDGHLVFPLTPGPAGEAAAPATAPLPVPPVNVTGYLRSEHGLGESVRVLVRALDAADVRSTLIDFNVGNSSRTLDGTFEERLGQAPERGVTIFDINADQMPVARLHLPRELFDGYSIGYWAWELPEFPDEWLSGFYGLDEIWVPSSFVQDAIAKKSPVPVLRIPHSVAFGVSAEAVRARFGLPSDRFLFLTMFDFSSYQERKNPRAVLDAFHRAFGADARHVGLVVKTNNSQHHPQTAAVLRAWLADHPDAIWIDETLSRQAVYDLLSVCDAFVSLHRSEGFGLGLAEAMYLGKPVIGTYWSGNTDFMRPGNSLPVDYRIVTIQTDVGVYRAGQQWAEPDVEHAASLMRGVVEDPDLRQRIGQAASRTIREEYSPEQVGRRIRDRLQFIGANFIGG